METTIVALATWLCAASDFELNQAQQTQLVDIAVARLKDAYPPAKSHFQLEVATKSGFGLRLVTALRKEGYAVTEQVGEEQPCKKKHHRTVARLVKCTASVRTASDGIPLAFAVDDEHLKLTVGQRVMARAFRLRADSIEILGQWVVIDLRP